jgi:tetratricopeptide (TPR) repeat protein
MNRILWLSSARPAIAAARPRSDSSRSGVAVALAAIILCSGGLMNAPSAGDLPDFNSFWDYDHPDSSEARFRAALPQARAAGDRDYLIQLLTQLARSEGLQLKFEQAHRTLDEALALFGDSSGVAPDSSGTASSGAAGAPGVAPALVKAWVRYYLERGRVFNSSNKKEDAIPFFLSAWNLARQVGEENLAVDAAHMLAIASPPDSAIEWSRKAMEAAEQAKDPKAKSWLGPLYNNLGWTYHDQGDYAKALELFRKSYQWRLEREQGKETRIAKWTIARTLRSMNRIDEALAMQRELLQEWEAAGTERDGYVFEEIGECLHSLGRNEEAAPNFAKAYELLSKDPWLSANEPDRLRRLASLGGVEGH